MSLKFLTVLLISAVLIQSRSIDSNTELIRDLINNNDFWNIYRELGSQQVSSIKSYGYKFLNMDIVNFFVLISKN